MTDLEQLLEDLDGLYLSPNRGVDIYKLLSPFYRKLSPSDRKILPYYTRLVEELHAYVVNSGVQKTSLDIPSGMIAESPVLSTVLLSQHNTHCNPTGHLMAILINYALESSKLGNRDQKRIEELTRYVRALMKAKDPQLVYRLYSICSIHKLTFLMEYYNIHQSVTSQSRFDPMWRQWIGHTVKQWIINSAQSSGTKPFVMPEHYTKPVVLPKPLSLLSLLSLRVLPNPSQTVMATN